jgi:hypothetical protein
MTYRTQRTGLRGLRGLPGSPWEWGEVSKNTYSIGLNNSYLPGSSPAVWAAGKSGKSGKGQKLRTIRSK